MADIFLPIGVPDNDADPGVVALSFIVDPDAEQLVGIKGNNRTSDRVTVKLELGPANNQKFDIVLPPDDATDREQIIPVPRRVPAVPDPDGGWEIAFVRVAVERRFSS